MVYRENDLLKEQLTRYIGMVKQQQNEQEGDSDIAAKLSEVINQFSYANTQCTV